MKRKFRLFPILFILILSVYVVQTYAYDIHQKNNKSCTKLLTSLSKNNLQENVIIRTMDIDTGTDNTANTPTDTGTDNTAGTPTDTGTGNTASTPTGTGTGNTASTPTGTETGNTASTPTDTGTGDTQSTSTDIGKGNTSDTSASTVTQSNQTKDTSTNANASVAGGTSTKSSVNSGAKTKKSTKNNTANNSTDKTNSAKDISSNSSQSNVNNAVNNIVTEKPVDSDVLIVKSSIEKGDINLSDKSILVKLSCDNVNFKELYYAWSSSKEVKHDETWTKYSEQLQFDKTGIWYLHYKAVDKSGNDTYGYFGPYNASHIFSAASTNDNSGLVKKKIVGYVLIFVLIAGAIVYLLKVNKFSLRKKAN